MLTWSRTQTRRTSRSTTTYYIVAMELGRVPTDQYAGYVEEDSDLEYSECSEGEERWDYHAITLINAHQ